MRESTQQPLLARRCLRESLRNRRAVVVTRDSKAASANQTASFRARPLRPRPAVSSRFFTDASRFFHGRPLPKKSTITDLRRFQTRSEGNPARTARRRNSFPPRHFSRPNGFVPHVPRSSREHPSPGLRPPSPEGRGVACDLMCDDAFMELSAPKDYVDSFRRGSEPEDCGGTFPTCLSTPISAARPDEGWSIAAELA